MTPKDFILFLAIATGTFCLSSGTEDDKGYLRVVSIAQPPFLMLEQNTSRTKILQGNERYIGFIPDLLKRIGHKTNITYRIHLVKDGLYGAMNWKGEWSGMIGEIIRREADIAAAPLTKTRDREAVLDFSYSFMSAPLTMLVHKDAPYAKVADLVNASYAETDYGVLAGGSTAASFGAATEPPYSQVWANMISKDNMMVESLEEGFRRVKDGNYVLIGERPDLEYAKRVYGCDVRTTQTFYFGEETRNYAFAVPNGHHKLADINQALLELREAGELQRLYMRWWNPTLCSGAERSYGSGATLAVCVLTAINFLRKSL